MGDGGRLMSESERAALKALMRGVAVLLRIESWRLFGRFELRDNRDWMMEQARMLKRESTALFKEATNL